MSDYEKGVCMYLQCQELGSRWDGRWVTTKAGTKCKKSLIRQVENLELLAYNISTEGITQVSNVTEFLLQQNILVPGYWWVIGRLLVGGFWWEAAGGLT